MMAAPSIVILGPQGCGKTRNADRLRRAYGLQRVIDAGAVCGTPLVRVPENGALVLTTSLAELDLPEGHKVQVVEFSAAMRKAGAA